MTHSELANVLMELEGQARALEEKGYICTAKALRAQIGDLCATHMSEIASSLKFWDAPLSLTKELLEEEIQKRKPPTPSIAEAQKLLNDV
jgi:hypothetical protein